MDTNSGTSNIFVGILVASIPCNSCFFVLTCPVLPGVVPATYIEVCVSWHSFTWPEVTAAAFTLQIIWESKCLCKIVK